MRILNRQGLEDIILGSATLSGGGGGQIEEALSYLDKVFSKTSTIKLVSLDEIPESTVLACPYRIGSLRNPDEANSRTGCKEPSLKAIRLLEKSQGNQITGFIPAEIGPVNTLLPFYAAASVGNGFVVDADPVGRSVPEMRQMSTWLADLPPRTIATCTGNGFTSLLTGINGPEEAEAHLRGLSERVTEGLYGIDHALPKRTIAPFLYSRTISKALNIGSEIRRFRERNADVAEAIAEIARGRVVFRGRLGSVQTREEGGFTVGHYEMSGLGQYEGRRYQVEYKNENMAGRLDGKVNVTIPEIICLIDECGIAVVNGGSRKIGEMLAVVVLPAPDHFLTEQGLRLFGPQYCGLEEEFKSALS